MANRWQTLSWVTGSAWGNGADGDLTISSNTTQASTSIACTGSGTTLTLGSSGFTNGDVCIVLQMQGGNAGEWEYTKIASGGGTTTLTTQKSLQYTYGSGAFIQKLPQYNDVTVNGSTTWTATAWDGSAKGLLGFIARGTVTVTGSISATGKGFLGGAGGTNVGTQGEGLDGSETASNSANGIGGGGGGRNPSSERSGGGGGGYATSGSNGGGPYYGNGGGTAGTASLTSLMAGGAGGGGGSSGSSNGAGANGGGIILIDARVITVSGSIVTNGNNSASAGATGGGGAGGSILIKSQIATLGSSLLTASAGTAASGSEVSGGNGGVGRIHLDYATSYTGTTSPTLDATLDKSLFGSVRRGFFI